MSYRSANDERGRAPADRLTPRGLTVLYLVFGFGLLVLSDELLPRLIADPTRLAFYQGLKGAIEVLLTGGFIYVLTTRMRTRLDRSEDRYYNVIRDSPAPINLFDETGESVWGNDAVLELLDLDDRAALLDRSIFEFIHPDDHELAESEMEEVLQRGGSTGPTPMRLVTDDGELRQIQVSTTVGWVSGELVGQALVIDMTERMALEDQLRLERDYLEAALDALRDPFYIVDEGGALRRWNDRVPEVTGYDESTLAGMDVLELFPEEERDRVSDAMEVALETGESMLEVDHLDADGERRRFEIRGARMEDADGNLLGLAGVGRDVTQRVEQERQLREVTEEYEAVFRNAQDSLFLLDVEGPAEDPQFRFQRLNPAHEAVSGLSTETVRGKTPREVLGEELGAAVVENYRHCVERRETLEYEEELPPLGEDVIWRTKLTPVIVDDEVTQIVGIARDVSERKRMERVLRENERRYRTLVEMSPEPILVNTDGTVAYCNKAFRELVGADVDESLHGREITEFFHPDEHADLRRTNDRIQRGHETTSARQRTLVTESGEERQVQGTARSIAYEGKPSVLAILQDVTEQHRHEERLRTLHERTQAMAREQDVDEIAGIAVDAARELLDAMAASYYQHDGSVGLRLRAADDDGRAGPPEPLDGGPVWEAFVDGESRFIDDLDGTAHETSASPTGAILPVGNHGVLVVGTEDDTPPEGTRRELARLIADNLEAELDRADREASLHDRDRRLARQNETLEQLEQLNGIIRRVVGALVSSSTRAEIGDRVCSEFAAADDYAFAWIAERDPADGTVRPVQWAGVDAEVIDHIGSLSPDAPLPSLVEAAFREGTARTASSILDDEAWAPHRQDARRWGFRSIAAVPVGRHDRVDSVLVLHGVSSDGFDPREREVLGELGQTIGYALENVGEVQPVGAAHRTEVELSIDDERLFTNRLTAAVDGPLELVGLVPGEGDTVRAFIRFTGAAGSTDLVATIAESAAVVSVDPLSLEDGRGLVLLTLDTPELFRILTANQARIASLTTGDGSSQLAVRLPHGVEVRPLIEELQAAYPATELIARRERTEPLETAEGFRDTVLEEMTARQREALRTATFGGFYDWPRAATSEELAGTLGIAASTFQYHLRAAERKTMTALLGEQTASAQ